MVQTVPAVPVVPGSSFSTPPTTSTSIPTARSATPTPGAACPRTTIPSAASSTATSVYGSQGASGSDTYGAGGR